MNISILTYFYYFDSEIVFTIPHSNPISVQEFNGKIAYITKGEFLAAVGDISMNVIQKEKIASTIINNSTSISRNLLIDSHKGVLQLFSLCLWMVKDSCVNPMETFLVYNDTSPLKVFRNTPAYLFTESNGKHSVKNFTEQEIVEALKWLDVLKPFMLITGEYNEQESVSPNEYGIRNPINPDLKHDDRFQRTLLFIQNARSQSFLPAKVASYIGAFESLFELDSEGSHQVGERSAKLIGGTLDERIINYKKLKKAYDVRSKYVHGSMAPRKFRTEENLAEVSFDLDSILRKVITILINQHPEISTMNNGEVTDWYNKMMLK